MASKNPHHEGNNSITFKGDPLTIPPQDLNIVWGEDGRYWKWNIQSGAQAELLQVCWLEVTGSVSNIDPKKSYEVRFKVSFTPDAFGWGDYPLYFMVKTGNDGKSAWKKVEIKSTDSDKEMYITGHSNPVKDLTDNSRLHFGLYEVWSGKWKGGLKIHNVNVREA